MHKKAKKFSRKLLALLMAVVMGITCFSGVISASAASSDVTYFDNDVEYNNLAWKVLSDEQTATAILDYLDILLAKEGPGLTKTIGKAISGLGISVLKWNESARQIKLSAVIVNATIDFHIYSVNELLHTLESAQTAIGKVANYVGDAKNIKLDATQGMTRENTSSVDILKGILAILQRNSADYNGKDVIGQVIRGNFGLGTIGNLANIDLYKILGDAFGLSADTVKADPVYNIVKHILMTNTNWFTDEEKQNYNNNPDSFVYDEVLLDKMTTQLLTKINAEITYKGAGKATESSKEHYKNIKDTMAADGSTFKAAAVKLGYDPELVYTEDGNVYLFVYGTNDDGSVADNAQKISLAKGDSLFKFGFEALSLAWKTALSSTLDTLRVNNDVNRGHGSNFDNAYYYWYLENLAPTTPWDTNNLAAMYSAANIQAWAEGVYASYGATSADEFLGWVKNNYEFDRDAAADSKGTWDDIDEETLFNKLRYSPLVDYYFAKQDATMKTGPINLYFMQTGAKNINEFFKEDNYRTYSSLVSGLNDALVAAVKDIFVDTDNVYGDATYPTLATTNPGSITASAISTIATTLTKNAAAVIEYTADSTDANILKAFHDNHPGVALAEENLEEAMLPMLIACLGQINLNGYKMQEYIHPEDWNACKDAEGVIFVALREYLSFILPDKDYNVLASKDSDDKFVATLEGTILPMARDAVVYVMQGYVPVDGADGKTYNVYERPVNDSTTIFDLLNSVIAYYGGEYTYKNRDIPKSVGAMSVGALLGICDQNGKSTISTDNTIWQNIDAVANKLLPVLGTLQYGDSASYGKFNSEDLIWNDIVKGVLNIADTQTNNGVAMGGVTNFLYRFLTIISAEPIQTTPVTLTVYDLVEDLINALFGARVDSRKNHDGQDWAHVVPERSSMPAANQSAPFDYVVHKAQLGGTDGSNVGIIQKLLCNFVEFSGYSNGGVNALPDSIVRGLMFAVNAVQSFIPGILGSIGDHDIKMGSAAYDEMTIQQCKEGSAYTSTLTFTNNSIGVNNAYVKNGSVEQLGRYWMKVTDATVEASDNSSGTVTGYTDELIAPTESITLNTNSTYKAGDDKATTFRATITYEIWSKKADGTATKLYGPLRTYAYQYLTGEQSWRDIVYPEGSELASDFNFKSSIGNNQSNKSKTSGGYTVYTSKDTNSLYVAYPEYMVIGTNNLSEINDFQFNIYTLQSSFGGSRSYDGFYCYYEGSVLNDWNNQYVTVGSSNAIPVFNKSTGDILKYGLYDYSTDGGKTWNRGTNNDGFSEGDATSAAAPYGENGIVRDHVAYTFDEAYSSGMIAAHHINPDTGLYEYIYLQSSSSNSYDTVLGRISCRGPVDGIYLNQGKLSVGKGYANTYTSSLFVYDGYTPIQAGQYPVKMAFYANAGTGTMNNGSCTLVVGDNNAADSLTSSYNAIKDVMNNYSDEDYTDASVKQTASDALLASLSAQAAVMTPQTALSLSDETQLTATTDVVDTQYGDRAYKPFAAVEGIAGTVYWKSADPDFAGYNALPGDVFADAFTGDDNILYFDEACTMPIYSDSPLTASDITNGKDAAGKAVIEGTDKDAGKFFLLNAPHYETEWTVSPNTYRNSADTADLPIHWRTLVKDANGQNVQAKNDAGKLLYEKVQYVYRDKDGNKVNSDFNWSCKFPVTSYTCLPNNPGANDAKQGDYRGRISQMADELAWVLEQVKAGINTSLASPIFENVSLVRHGMNNNNFDVVTYNKMTEVAQTAEDNYRITVDYNGYVPVLDEAGNETRYDADVIDEEGNIIHSAGDVVTELKNGIVAENVKFTDYARNYMNNDQITINSVTTTSSLSSVQVAEYQRLYSLYATAVVERGYNGNQLEAEIRCAAGNAYDAFTATPAVYEKDVKVSEAVVETTAATVPFGAVEGGKLVNNGPIVYADNLWNEYVEALADAVAMATEANTTYPYKAANTFSLADKDAYTCQVTDCYSTDTRLQAAEIALENAVLVTVDADAAKGGTVSIDGKTVDRTKAYGVAENSWLAVNGVADEGYQFVGFAEDTLGAGSGQIVVGEPDAEGNATYNTWIKDTDAVLVPVFESAAPNTFAVTGSVVVATDGKGATAGTAVNGDYTITAYNADGTVAATTTVTMSAGNNAFTLDLAPGTYKATIESQYALTREDITITVTDHDVDGGAIPIVACDYNGSGSVSAADALTIYTNASGAQNLYCDLNGSGSVSAADALIVFVCGAGGTMTPVEIK